MNLQTIKRRRLRLQCQHSLAPALMCVVLLQTQAGFTHAVACTGQSSPAGSRASSVERQRDSIDRLSQPRHVGMQSPGSRRPWGSPARPDSRGAVRDATTRIQRGSSCEAHENSGNTKPSLQASMNLAHLHIETHLSALDCSLMTHAPHRVCGHSRANPVAWPGAARHESQAQSTRQASAATSYARRW